MRNESDGRVRDLSHPLRATMQKVQQKAKHVSATATFKNIIGSKQRMHESCLRGQYQYHDSPSRPLRIAAIVISSVLNIKVNPPHARKKLPSASVGGRDGRIERGGSSQTKKYVRHRSTENATSKYPQRAWIWTCL